MSTRVDFLVGVSATSIRGMSTKVDILVGASVDSPGFDSRPTPFAGSLGLRTQFRARSCNETGLPMSKPSLPDGGGGTDTLCLQMQRSFG